MLKVCLFIKDFKLGAQVASRLADLGAEVGFADDLSCPGILDATLSIVDLDYESQGTVRFISQLRHKNVNQFLLGYMLRIQKDILEKLTAAGCELVVPQSTLVKNLPSILRMTKSDDHSKK